MFLDLLKPVRYVFSICLPLHQCLLNKHPELLKLQKNLCATGKHIQKSCRKLTWVSKGHPEKTLTTSVEPAKSLKSSDPGLAERPRSTCPESDRVAPTSLAQSLYFLVPCGLQLCRI